MQGSVAVKKATKTTTTTADETKDWNTYTNDTYGFSFKYPKDWKTQDDKSGDIYLTDTKKLIHRKGLI